MNALTFGGKEIIEYSSVKDPELLQPSDAIVQITMAGLCGSDLHVYHGLETGLDPQPYAIEDIITHQFSLQEGAKAYEAFDKKPDNCIKPVLLT